MRIRQTLHVGTLSCFRAQGLKQWKAVLRIHDILVWILIWILGLLIDPDPDPAIFVTDLPKIFFQVFYFLLYEGTFTSFYIDKKSERRRKKVEILLLEIY